MTIQLGVFVGACLAMAAACAGTRNESGAATPQLIAKSLGAAPAYYTLQDGDRVAVFRPQNHGDAVCGENLCVLKAEITRVQFTAPPGRGENLILAPLIPLAGGMLISPYNPTGREASPPPSRAAPECAAHADPAPPGEAAASMQGMADWVWRSRLHINAACLSRMSGWLMSDGDRSVAHELLLLADAREAWAKARCRDAVIGASRVMPPLGAGTNGDLSWLRRVREVIADPATYDARVPESECAGKGGVAPPAEWAERRLLLMERLDPFSRHPLLLAGETDASGVYHDGRREPAVVWSSPG